MNFIIKLIMLAGAIYAGLWLYENHFKPSPPPTPPPSQTAPSPFKQIKCKTCSETGKLVDESGAIKVAYRCPLCEGAGKRTLPTSASVCHYCGGLGKVARNSTPPSKRVMGQRCPICDGSGSS